MERDKKIIKTSIIGILTNVALVLVKGTIGIIANSVALVMDAVNNLSDALSSVITIIGTKLSTRKPDKKHPYGHGRVEYITSAIIAFIVLIAGLTSLKESVERIISPQETEYKIYSLIVIAIMVGAKFALGTYVKSVGKKLNSQTLVASGTDAFFDGILSFSTLVGAIIVMTTGFHVAEGILGTLISLFIIKSGVGIIKETFDSIIGIRADTELSVGIREVVTSFPEVKGAYDLTLHNYGHNKTIGSVHIEVDDEMPAKRIHSLSREIIYAVYQKYGVIMTVGIYSSGDDTPLANEIKNALYEAVKDNEDVLQTHGFYFEEKQKYASFDLVVSFDADAEKVKNEVIGQLNEKFPDIKFIVVIDSDFSD